MSAKFLSDRKLAALLFVLGALFATAYLHTYREAFGLQYLAEHEIFGRAVMVASGRGSAEPAVGTVPGLDDFLSQKTPSFDPRNIPAKVETAYDESVSGYHRYLVYAIGLTWRVFGISWASIKYLMGILFGATIAIGYGLLRLGMNRLVGFVGALLFMISPAMLVTLSRVRDFTKAPFVLGAVLIMGRLAKGPVSARAYLGLAALLGLVIGVGMGFRQDALICLPPSVVIVGLLTCGECRFSIPRRAAAMAILLACFAATAWPMFLWMDSGGAQPYHPIVQGFGTEMRDNLGLGMAGYEPLSRDDDNFVFATLCSYDERVNGASGYMTYNSALAVQTGKQWILETARTFPADVITRVYAAVLWALGDGGMQTDRELPPYRWAGAIVSVARPFSIHMYYYGVWYLALALLILSGHSPRLSGLLLFFLLYFCGYVSLEFQYRHAFHLCLTPLWILGFLIEGLIHGMGGLMRAEGRTRFAAVLFDPRRWWTSPVRRALLFCIGAGLALFVPLYGARIYQHVLVGNLLQQYAAAALEPVETVQEPLGDWTLFRPSARVRPVTQGADYSKELPFYVASWLLLRQIAWTPLGADLLCAGTNRFAASKGFVRPRQWETHTGYLAAELTATSKERLLLLKYESEIPTNNFSQLAYVAAAPSGCGTVRYFFPVYELCMDNERREGRRLWNRFVGIGLPQEQAADVKALYRVENVQDFRLLLNLSLPEDLDSFQGHQAIVKHSDFAHRYACAEKPWGCMARANAKQAAGDTDEALMLYRAALALDPNNAFGEFQAAELFQEKGDDDAAAHAYETAIRLNPDFSSAYERLGALLQRRADPADPVTVWRRIADAYPGAGLAQIRLAAALESQGNLAEAVTLYRAAAAAQPDNGAIPTMLAAALIKTGAYAEAVSVFQKVFQHNPMKDEFRWMFIKALMETGQYDAAWDEVVVCRNRGVGLPPELVQALEERSGRKVP